MAAVQSAADEVLTGAVAADVQGKSQAEIEAVGEEWTNSGKGVITTTVDASDRTCIVVEAVHEEHKDIKTIRGTGNGCVYDENGDLTNTPGDNTGDEDGGVIVPPDTDEEVDNFIVEKVGFDAMVFRVVDPSDDINNRSIESFEAKITTPQGRSVVLDNMVESWGNNIYRDCVNNRCPNVSVYITENSMDNLFIDGFKTVEEFEEYTGKLNVDFKVVLKSGEVIEGSYSDIDISTLGKNIDADAIYQKYESGEYEDDWYEENETLLYEIEQCNYNPEYCSIKPILRTELNDVRNPLTIENGVLIATGSAI